MTSPQPTDAERRRRVREVFWIGPNRGPFSPAAEIGAIASTLLGQTGMVGSPTLAPIRALLMRSVRGTAPNDRPVLGKTLRNTHRLVELLDRGGMGSVCVAEHQRLDRKLAVKVSRSTSNDVHALARFHREAARARGSRPHRATTCASARGRASRAGGRYSFAVIAYEALGSATPFPYRAPASPEHGSFIARAREAFGLGDLDLHEQPTSTGWTCTSRRSFCRASTTASRSRSFSISHRRLATRHCATWSRCYGKVRSGSSDGIDETQYGL